MQHKQPEAVEITVGQQENTAQPVQQMAEQ